MPSRSRKRKKHSAPKGSTRAKGNIVERITASMHDMPSVIVETNVFLPPKSGKGRHREIDVLVTSQVVGYPIRVAIECKNEKRAIGAGKIDAFVGKLNHVGIPTQLSIYVSASGYTSDAVERAKEAGIRALVLKGLTKEGLSTAVAEAFQSVIYLLLEVQEFTVAFGRPLDTPPIPVFRNDDGELYGTPPDLVWQAWCNGQPPSIIGEQELELTIPSGWNPFVGGTIERIDSIKAKVRVLGLVVMLSGRVEQYMLVDASDGRPERSQVSVSFDASQSTYPVTTFYTEGDLREFLDRQPASARLTIGRIRLPRIRAFGVYWPPSERVGPILAWLGQAIKEGRIADPRSINYGQLEGSDMRTAWEPIWQEHPAVKERNKKSDQDRESRPPS